MLNRIGGCSVAEAKESLSHEEVLKWQGYRERRGTLNLGLRVEVGFALIAYSINRALGGKANMDDFMPHMAEQEATISDIMNMLAGSK